ncbi:MAG TPA: fumarate hydratase [Stellaceae bacterium]|nr:fumarate hydratase [Stellaceae bacterium]
MSETFHHLFQLGPDETPYRKLTDKHVSVETIGGRKVLRIEPEALSILAKAAFHDISHLLRPTHLAQVASILKDPEASANDRFVALELLKNANIAAGGTLPMCQDTGTAIIVAHKGEQVWTGADDTAYLSEGIKGSYKDGNLRYSQMAPLSLYEEVNTGNNLPAQIDILAEPGSDYHFLFVAKGGGSANKTYLYQETRATLSPKTFAKFITDKIATLGTAACPPYHLAIVIGGLSAEQNLKTVKLASTHYLDNLPTTGDKSGRAFRDVAFEQEVLEITRQLGIGAQFGGKYFCHDVRVIRLPRHGASMPIGIGVSCSADRQALGKIDEHGVWLEDLERDPARFLPETEDSSLSGETVEIDLTQPMDKIRETLSKCPVGTRLNLNGPMIVARDIAHAKWKEIVDAGGELPEYTKHHPVYYAGPAKTPEGMASGSFGPTTAGRMDSYADFLLSRGSSLVMLAKGNRSNQVKQACKDYGGFYLGSIGGAAARLALDSIKKVEVLDYPELGMEAVWRIEVQGFPAFVITDDKGNDFFANVAH